MGTASLIGVWNETTGEVVASYCHYDGYIVGGNGQTLTESYNTTTAADTVAYGGYLSALYNDYTKSLAEAVHKDKPMTFGSVEEYLIELTEEGQVSHVPYLYLWDGEGWFVASNTKPLFEEVELTLKVA
jgi:hypothetical protein